MKKIFSLLFLLSISAFANAQSSIFVAMNGDDSNGNGSLAQPFKTVDEASKNANPSDTIFIKSGIYYNENFGDGDAWKIENTVRINNLNGLPNQYITIKPYANGSVIFKGDAANIFRMTNSSYVRIEGLEIYGEVENISLDTALAYQFLYKDQNGNLQYRVPPGTSDAVIATMTFPVLNNIQRGSYTNTRGLYINNVHHIDLINNHIHHAPGTGFRVAEADYINAIGNKVHDCSRKSYAGTHGFVFSNCVSMDNNNDVKIIVARNEVFDNYNEIYSWAPSKTIITPVIDEGKGISMQRNSAAFGWNNGKFLIENNIAYNNGFSGIHLNGCERFDIRNNTVVNNNYTTAINGHGSNHGISTQTSDDVLIINNIAISATNLPQGNCLNISNNCTNITIRKNLTSGNISGDVAAIATNMLTCSADFVAVTNNNFTLQNTSCAIDAGSVNNAPTTDFYNNQRDASPDLGAIEFDAMTNSFNRQILNFDIKIYPNPSVDFVFVESSEIIHSPIFVVNNLGQVMDCKVENQGEKVVKVEVYHLPKGIYFIKNEKFTFQFMKM